MSELKPCIRCGGHMSWNDNEFESAYVCDDCHYFIEWDGTPEEFVKWWNSRPIEDALNARIAELEAEKCVLVDQQREAKNHLIDKNLHIDSLYEEGYKLQQRIAELEEENDRLLFWLVSAEEEIDQLTAHGDIERQDDKWIPEVQE